MSLRTLTDLRAWLESAPAGTAVPAASLLAQLQALEPAPAVPMRSLQPVPLTWRERLWLVPAETRLGIAEVSEALSRSKSWIYKRTSERSDLPRLPHRKLDGELLFVAGELRTWIRDHEEVIESVPLDSTPAERAGLLKVV